MEGYALITGASAGIGAEFAREAARRRFDGLVLVARRLERLEALREEIATSGYSSEILVRQCDLREARERDALLSSLPPVSLLVNNAGFGYVGSFLKDDPANINDMISTNCQAPLHLARGLIPPMVERGRGAVINVASIAAYPPIPYMAEYGATKALLLNWSVALREELRGSGVNVLALCPGPTESEFHLVAGVQEKISLVPPMSAREVVEQAFSSLGSAVRINGWKNALMAELPRLFPKSVVARIARSMLEGRVPPEKR